MTNTPDNKRISNDPEAIKEALEALLKYQNSSMSMRRVLREMRTESTSEQYALHEPLALGVIRYLNTIDFLLARSLGSIRPQDLTPCDRNLLRLAIYDVRWLGSAGVVEYTKGLNSSLCEALDKAINLDFDATIKPLPKVNQESLRYSHPTFIIETLLEHLGERDTYQLLSANNRSRVYYLRPNKHREGYEESIKKVQELGVRLIPDSSVKDLFRISGDVNAVVSSDLFQNGDILIHDKASILTVKALHASQAEIIWDACAAPGMKTHLLTEVMNNTGRIVASDVYTDRVRSAKKRSEFLGMRNVCWVQADASMMKVKGARRVLIDAPCSSTGMIQGHPSFKWRLNKEVLMSIMSVQHKILDGVLRSYRDEPGTEIVYATCSILPHEGESQIDSVMSTHNIELIDTEIRGDPGYDGFQCSEMVRRLFPHKHETSGFFIARMRIVQ
ncbi:MAG: hypothetical protein C4K48_07490 [Candidatus Thorarchaeota archaeon]|nr:MAG: hypothetical protein C4K48_07490 [Candidatus Thorarchaeota archaeon]